MGAYPSSTLQASRIWNLPQNIASDLDGFSTIFFGVGGNYASSTEALKSLKARTKNTRAKLVSTSWKNSMRMKTQVTCGAIKCDFWNLRKYHWQWSTRSIDKLMRNHWRRRNRRGCVANSEIQVRRASEAVSLYSNVTIIVLVAPCNGEYEHCVCAWKEHTVGGDGATVRQQARFLWVGESLGCWHSGWVFHAHMWSDRRLNEGRAGSLDPRSRRQFGWYRCD